MLKYTLIAAFVWRGTVKVVNMARHYFGAMTDGQVFNFACPGHPSSFMTAPYTPKVVATTPFRGLIDFRFAGPVIRNGQLSICRRAVPVKLDCIDTKGW